MGVLLAAGLLLMSGCAKQSKPAASAGPGSGFSLIAL